MEPSSNAEYSKQAYWDQRYTGEEHYDWFPSVYAACVTAAFDAIEAVHNARTSASASSLRDGTVKVLHLGTGNSTLCADISAAYEARYPDAASRPYRLVQVATDYSTVVIERMKTKYGAAHPLKDVHWEVADIRDLSAVRAQYGPYFDVVLDKGTMDALQADKSNDNMDDDIDRMLAEVSKCVEGGTGAHDYRVFLQMTWEVPYYRLHYTTKNAMHTFSWGTNAKYRFLGDSDMYRVYTYEVSPPQAS
jgi:EEF1A lysine methyltransferase 4